MATSSASIADAFRGLNSGEFLCRVMSRTSSSAITVLDGLDKDMATFLHMPLPSPSEHAMKRAFLRTRRAQCRRKAQLEVDSIRATATALASSATTAVHVETLRCASEGYSTEFASCRRSVDQALMTYLLRFYASIEVERRHLLHVQSMERAVCDAALARAKRNLHLDTFALYLESESAGQVQFRRLDATHPQGVRCRRAALDNVKPHGPRMQVVDVYKIENHVVLERFQSVVASLPSPKVKGLFCSVPVAAIERCVAFGMTGDSNPPVFRASWYSNTSKYAQPVATAAAPIQFPKRFSRYSSFDTANSHRCHHETTTQFLALCRVVMQQVAIAPAATSSPFPSPSIDTMYFNAEEEYLVRHGHYVVPEFLIQLEIDEPVSTQVVPLKGTATSTSGLQGENDLAPVLELALLGPHDQLPRPTAFPFESVVAGINNVPAAAPVGPSKGLRKMKPELFGTTAASDCPPTTPDFHVKKQWLLVRTSVVHATVGALHQFWDRMGQAWHLRYRNHNTSSMIRHSNNQLESGDTTVPLSDTKAWSGKAKSVKAKLKAAIIATSGSPYCVGR